MRYPIIPIAISSLGLLGVLACSSDEPTIMRVELDALAIDADRPMVAVGERIDFAVSALYTDGSTKSLAAGVTWTSADPSVAKHVVGSTFEGLSVGEVEIAAAFLDERDSVILTVVASPIASLDLQPSSATLEEGQTRAFTAFANFDDGTRLDVTTEVIWSSTAPSVATVQAGLASALVPGETEIVATADNGVRTSATLTVTAARLVGIDVSPALREVALGLSLQIDAYGMFSNGSTRAITSQLEWASNNPAIALVSDAPGSKGMVTSVSEGQTTVTATDPGTGTRAGVTVRVTPAELAALTVTPRSSTIAAGDRVFLFAQGMLTDGTSADVTRTVNWTSSDPNVALAFDTAFERGQIVGQSPGRVVISVRHPDGISSADSGGSASVTVTPARLQGISVEPRTAAVPAGLTTPFSAFGNFSDGVRRNITGTVQWSTSNASQATVDGQGVATGVAVGTVSVSAMDPASGVSSGASGSAQLTVQPPQLVSLGVTPSSAPMVAGDQLRFVATGVYSDGSTPNISSQVQWASNGAAVMVDATGLATAQGAGTATISATHPQTGITSGATNQNAVATVVPLQLVSLDVTPPVVTAPVGVEVEFAALGTYNNANVVDLTDVVDWSSDRPNVASVPANGPTAGIATALAAGSTSISVFDSASGLSSDSAGTSATMTVSSSVSLVSLAVSAPTTTLIVGTNTPLTALGTFSNQAVFQLTNSVTWSSSNPTVATVDNTAGMRGILTARAVGTSVVSAVHGGTGISSTTNPTITVQPGIVSETWPGPTVTVDGTAAYAVAVGSVTFNSTQFGPGATITDVDIAITFRKTDGSCASPASGFAYHNETSFRLQGPTGTQVILAAPNTWSGGTATGPVNVTFDQSAAGPPSATPVSGTFRPNPGNLDSFNTQSPLGTWVLQAGDSAGADPLCVMAYTVTVTAQ